MRFEVTVLGSNGAVPTPGRHASAHFFRSEQTDLLIDCGEGTQTRLQLAGFGFSRVSHVLITHLHGDHYFGLPGLLTSLALGGRASPLEIVSPPGLREKLAPLLELDRYRLPFSLTFREHAAVDFGPLLSLADVDVFSFPLEHRIATNGYLVREKTRPANMRKATIDRYGIPWQRIPAIKAGGDYRTEGGTVIPHADLTAPAAPPRSYAYCSDTIYLPRLAQWVRGVDLLYHESTFLHDMAEEARHKGHSTAREAALIADAAGVGRLILGHFSSRYRDVTDHECEARKVFPEAYAARDLYRYTVPYGRALPYAAVQ